MPPQKGKRKGNRSRKRRPVRARPRGKLSHHHAALYISVAGVVICAMAFIDGKFDDKRRADIESFNKLIGEHANNPARANGPLFKDVRFHATLIAQAVCPAVCALNVAFETLVVNDTQKTIQWYPQLIEYPGLVDARFLIGRTPEELRDEQPLEPIIRDGQRIGFLAPIRTLRPGSNLQFKANWQLIVRCTDRRELCVARRVAPPIEIGCQVQAGFHPGEFDVRLIGHRIQRTNNFEDIRWHWQHMSDEGGAFATLVWINQNIAKECGEDNGHDRMLLGQYISTHDFNDSKQDVREHLVRLVRASIVPVSNYALARKPDTIESPFRSSTCHYAHANALRT
jgi:hypothetical protein